MNQLFHNIFNAMVLILFEVKNRGIFFFRNLFADAMSVHSSNMKHAHVIEFD